MKIETGGPLPGDLGGMGRRLPDFYQMILDHTDAECSRSTSRAHFVGHRMPTARGPAHRAGEGFPPPVADARFWRAPLYGRPIPAIPPLFCGQAAGECPSHRQHGARDGEAADDKGEKRLGIWPPTARSRPGSPPNEAGRIEGSCPTTIQKIVMSIIYDEIKRAKRAAGRNSPPSTGCCKHAATRHFAAAELRLRSARPARFLHRRHGSAGEKSILAAANACGKSEAAASTPAQLRRFSFVCR